MTRATSSERARLAGNVRLGVLALVALLTSHTAIYAAEFGTSDRLGPALAVSGHDGWWLPACVAILAVGLALLVPVLGGPAHLEWRARSFAAPPRAGVTSFARDARTIWSRLLPLVTILFVAQENVERLATQGHLAGLDPLLGGDPAIVLPLLVAITLGFAALGALVRW